MAGYTKLAQGASAADMATRLDLIAKRKSEEPLHDFFRGVRTHLGNEISQANAELFKQGLFD
jgi:hypothetical protein